MKGSISKYSTAHWCLIIHALHPSSLGKGVQESSVTMGSLSTGAFYPALEVIVKVCRGRAGGREQKKEACTFVTLMSGPLRLWAAGHMEAGEG